MNIWIISDSNFLFLTLLLEYELKEALNELNVKGVFDPAVANFSSLIQATDTANPAIALSQLDHKANIQWTEESDKATINEPLPQKKEASIAVNKPFLFFIVDVPLVKTPAVAPAVDDHNEPMIIFAGRIKTLSKDTAFTTI